MELYVIEYAYSRSIESLTRRNFRVKRFACVRSVGAFGGFFRDRFGTRFANGILNSGIEIGESFFFFLEKCTQPGVFYVEVISFPGNKYSCFRVNILDPKVSSFLSNVAIFKLFAKYSIELG